MSNTFMLEKDFGWKGILSEPAKSWETSLKSNRSCTIDTRCVHSESGKVVEFTESTDAVYSTLTEFVEGDYHHQKRTNGLTYLVQTVTLSDLLKENFAPKEIHYLSIDTEGSEFEIIRNFDFQEYKIHIISIEHNYTPAREKIFTLLTSHGYDRVLSQVSHFDDWYVLTR